MHTVAKGTLAPGDVLVRDGRIAAVGAHIQAPADRTLDLAGLHLFPGLVSASTDLGLVEISGVRASVDKRETGEFTPEVEAWMAVNPDSELIPVARANGITHFAPVPQGRFISGTSALLAAKWLFGFTHFGALQMANFDSDFFEGCSDNRQRRKVMGVAVALNHL